MFVKNGSVLIVKNIKLENIIVIRNCLDLILKSEIRNFFFMILRYGKMMCFSVRWDIVCFVLDVDIVLKSYVSVLIVDYVRIVVIYFVV